MLFSFLLFHLRMKKKKKKKKSLSFYFHSSSFIFLPFLFFFSPSSSSSSSSCPAIFQKTRRMAAKEECHRLKYQKWKKKIQEKKRKKRQQNLRKYYERNNKFINKKWKRGIFVFIEHCVAVLHNGNCSAVVSILFFPIVPLPLLFFLWLT